MNNELNKEVKWSENVVLADADYVDSVAFNLIVNFERMIGRRIPQADIAKWLDCIALDGGIRDGENEIQVILIHQKDKQQMDNFVPGNYQNDLSSKAFKDHLGEFTINAYHTEGFAKTGDFFNEVLELVCAQKDIKRLMVIPNAEDTPIYNKVRETLRKADNDDKRITVFTMQPTVGGNFRQEILGYSLMAALGIKADEIKD
ncbi:DUF6621 family protein [Prevotella sp. P6B4]|uniref:DUF6621 family protein n=1 Tax=Prevotella sp. P6B4 TaxID=1410614 RepID=UPI00048B3CA6|nr:DUF6621 family protein [Prevotella sp. P6B4]